MYANIPFIQKSIHILPVLPVYAIIFDVSLCVNYYILYDYTSPKFYKDFIKYIINPMGVLLIISHLQSMFCTPGFVSIPFKSDNKKDNDCYCSKCNNPRPSRAHHCRICNKCTLRMDHHCPWIANCVGYYNRKFFYQFLFYATLGDFLCFLLLIGKLYTTDMTMNGNVPNGIHVDNAIQLLWYMWRPIMLLIALLCAFFMTISIGLLFYKQTMMLLNNQTTIETNLYPINNNNPFYNTNHMDNFKSVMGKTVYDWVSFKCASNTVYI